MKKIISNPIFLTFVAICILLNGNSLFNRARKIYYNSGHYDRGGKPYPWDARYYFDQISIGKCIKYQQSDSIVNSGPESLRRVLRHTITLAKGKLINTCDVRAEVISLGLGYSINGKVYNVEYVSKDGVKNVSLSARKYSTNLLHLVDEVTFGDKNDLSAYEDLKYLVFPKGQLIEPNDSIPINIIHQEGSLAEHIKPGDQMNFIMDYPSTHTTLYPAKGISKEDWKKYGLQGLVAVKYTVKNPAGEVRITLSPRGCFIVGYPECKGDYLLVNKQNGKEILNSIDFFEAGETNVIGTR